MCLLAGYDRRHPCRGVCDPLRRGRCIREPYVLPALHKQFLRLAITENTRRVHRGYTSCVGQEQDDIFRLLRPLGVRKSKTRQERRRQ